MRRQPGLRRILGLALAVLAVGLPTGISVLDARELPGEVRIESEHDPGRCAVVHDHAACAQLLGSLALPAATSPPPHRAIGAARVLRTSAEAPPRCRPDPLRRPRAPPSHTA